MAKKTEINEKVQGHKEMVNAVVDNVKGSSDEMLILLNSVINSEMVARMPGWKKNKTEKEHKEPLDDGSRWKSKADLKLYEWALLWVAVAVVLFISSVNTLLIYALAVR